MRYIAYFLIGRDYYLVVVIVADNCDLILWLVFFMRRTIVWLQRRDDDNTRRRPDATKTRWDEYQTKATRRREKSDMNKCTYVSLHFHSHFPSVHLSSLHFHFTPFHFISLHFTSLHVTSLHFNSVHFSSLQLHCTSLLTSLQSSCTPTLHFPVLFTSKNIGVLREANSYHSWS